MGFLRLDVIRLSYSIEMPEIATVVPTGLCIIQTFTIKMDASKVPHTLLELSLDEYFA